MEIAYPTWFLLYVPPILFLTLLVNYIYGAAVFTCLSVCLKCKTKWKLYKQTFLGIWVVGIAGDVGATVLFLLVSFVAPSVQFLYDAVVQPFSSVLGFITAFIVILAAGYLKYVLNRKVVFKKTDLLDDKSKKYMSLLLGLLTAPWTYIVPTEVAWKWLSSILTGIGRLGGMS